MLAGRGRSSATTKREPSRDPLRWLWREMLEDDDPREPAPDEIVCVAEVEGEGTAEMWCGMLEQRGIHSMAKNVSTLAPWRLGSQ